MNVCSESMVIGMLGQRKLAVALLLRDACLRPGR
jgi:hypothetical protein